MSLKVRDIKRIIEDFAPVKLKESYDNVGLMVGDLDKEVTSILVALDCTLEVIDEAVEKGCNLILTHHPLLFKKPSSITGETLTGKKIMELIKNDISLYSAHTNLDVVGGGINDTVMNILGFNEYVTMKLSSGRHFEDSKSGIGRLATLDKSITLKYLCSRVKRSLKVPYVRYAGEESMEIKNISVINGSGQDYFSLAKEMGADCIITGDTSYHYVTDFSEEGIGIIDAGHFATEWSALKVLTYTMEIKLQRMGFINRVVVSEKGKDPYKIY